MAVDDDDTAPNKAFDLEAPTPVETRFLCPGCGRDAMKLHESVQPPSIYKEAWKRKCCYGTEKWFFCENMTDRPGKGRLILIGEMEVYFFPPGEDPDALLVSAVSITERRKLLPLKSGT